MTLFLAAVAIGVIAAGWVVVPLVLRRSALLMDSSPAGRLDAEARRRVALASLKDVEYDRVSGKLDDRDYARLRSQLEREALDAITAAEASGAGGAPAPSGRHACGFVNPPGSHFCSGCGRRLG